MPPVLIRARVTAATLFAFVTRVEPVPAPVADTSEETPLGSDAMVSPVEGAAETVALRPPIVVLSGSVTVVRTLTVTVVGLTNGTKTVLEVTTGELPAVALTLMLPTTELLRVTDATPPDVMAVADESVPSVPVRMVNVTVVPSAIVPLALFCGVRVAVRVTAPRLLITPEIRFVTRLMDAGLLGSVKTIGWLPVVVPVAEEVVAVMVTLPSTVLVNVVDALPFASVTAVDDERVPVPDVIAKETVVPAGTGPPPKLTTLAVMVTVLPAK